MLQGKPEEEYKVLLTYILENMENNYSRAFTNMDFKKDIPTSAIINFTHIRNEKYQI